MGEKFDYGESYWEEYYRRAQPLFRNRESHMLSNKFWVRYLKKLKKGKLLDVGCGRGFFLKEAEKHYLTYGVDIDQYNIKMSTSNTPSSILFADVNDLSLFNDEFFDIVTCFDVLEHVAKPFFALKEIHRVLKVGGISVITTPNVNSIGRS
jgi:2-polyprenyl-3-methyl-5-hydroxy-6-metoxy-1,4-benzoquinol methylase